MPTDVPFHVDDVSPERREVGELAGTRRRLGAAAGALRMGIALIEIDSGKRFSPPHSHADEDEVFLVLAGSGLSYLTSSPEDVRTYAVGVDDVLWHPAGGDANTLIAGDAGLTVLVVAEGSRTHITFLPRTGQFWLGPRWAPADTKHPFAADAALGPLELPAPDTERPSNIRNLSELPLHAGSRSFGRLVLYGKGFDEDAREVATSLAGQAVIALDNARLHAIVERQELVEVVAPVDLLDGLEEHEAVAIVLRGIAGEHAGQAVGPRLGEQLHHQRRAAIPRVR